MNRLCCLAAAFAAACSGVVDPGALACRNDGECPSGSYCAAAQKCALGSRTLEAPVLTVTNLASSGATTSITLGWSRPIGATDYDLYRGNTVAGETLLLTLTDPTNSYLDVETAVGQTFHYRVVAKNAGGGVSSNDVSAVTVPASPTGLHVTSATSSGVTLAWTASPTAASYTVTRGAGSAQTAVGTVSAPAVQLTDATAQPSASYAYTVTASDATGALTSPPSAATNFVTATPQPANVSAAPVDDKNVTVSWDFAPAGVDTFDVFRGPTSGGETSAAVNTTPIPNTATAGRVSFIDPTAAPNTRYFYTVRANHNSAPMQSSAASATEGNALTYFTAPTGLSVSAGANSDSQTTLTWTRPAGSAFNYDILRGIVAGQEFVANTYIDDGTTTIAFTDFQLVPGVTYFYKVRVHDPVTNNVSLPISVLPVPGFQTTNNNGPSFGVIAVDATHVKVNIAHLQGFDTYDLLRNTSNSTAGGTVVKTLTAASGDLSYTDPVSTGVAYWYTARARFSGGSQVTPYAPLLSVTTSASPVVSGTPTNLAVQASGGGEVLLTWRTDSFATSFRVTRTGTPAGTFTTSNPYYADTGLTTGQIYSYTVQSFNSAGVTNGGLSSPVSTPALADPSVTFLCSPPRRIRNYSDGATTLGLAFGTPRIVAPGFSSIIQQLPDGNCIGSLPPVASGAFYLARGSQYFLVTNRPATATQMDLSIDSYGRATSTSYSSTTPVAFTAGNLVPWTATSHLELFASNVNAAGYTLEQAALAGLPALGATTLSGFLVDANAWGVEVDTATFNDKPVLVQMNDLTSSNGVPYSAATRSAAIGILSGPDGRALAVNAGLFGDATATVSPVPFIYLRSKFKALAPSINPAALTNAVPDSISFNAVPRDASGAAHPFIMAPADVLKFTLDSGTADVNAGNILVPAPYPSSWYSYAIIATSYTVPVNCGTAAASGFTPYPYTSGEEIIDDLASILTKAATGIGPPLQPATSPTIANSTGGAPVSAFTDNLGVGLTPTLSWAAVNGAVAPTYYRIFIYQNSPDASNNCAGNFIAQLHTTGTSLTLPAGILTAGSAYFAAIRPTYEPERSILTAPFIRGQHEFFVETVTNRFVP